MNENQEKKEKRVSVQAYVSESIRNQIIDRALQENFPSESSYASMLLKKGLEAVKAEENGKKGENHE